MTTERMMQWFLGTVMAVAWIGSEMVNRHVDKLPETAIGIIGTLVAWNTGIAAYKKVKAYKISKK